MNLGNKKKGKVIIEGIVPLLLLWGNTGKGYEVCIQWRKEHNKGIGKTSNSYRSSSSRGINAGATIGYGHKIQTTGNGESISVSRSNQNTVETIYANGSFTNVNEVHNNTGSMVLNGFNQEGGKVTGNIGKVEVISRQNTSTTTGSSRGMSLGISANGVPSSVNINGSRTNGDRAFVDNQSTFIVGEGSNLHVGTLENTGAVIGKEGNSTFKIDTYVGKDIQNHDTMKTTGGSIGVSTGNLRLTNIGVNQDSRDKQGITRNTVVGDVEIAGAEGSPINRDITRANETTKDTHSSANINIESQTIEYAVNPAKLKEDIGKAKEEINDIKWAIKESIHDRGDDNRNFFGQLSEVRLDKSLENITSERLIGKTVDTEIAGIFKDAYKDLGYDINIIFSDPKNSPQLKDEDGNPKTGTAYVDDYGVKTIIINAQDSKNTTKAGLIGTIVEEGSHVIGKVEGRQRKTGTDEKGLESTGRASNEYFTEKYKDDNTPISIHSDGKDYSNVDFGENVGDREIIDDDYDQNSRRFAILIVSLKLKKQRSEIGPSYNKQIESIMKQIEQAGIKFGGKYKIYDNRTIEIVSLRSYDDLIAVSKIFSNNGIKLVMSDIYTAANMQKNSNQPIKIDLRQSNWTAEIIPTITGVFLNGRVGKNNNNKPKSNPQKNSNANNSTKKQPELNVDRQGKHDPSHRNYKNGKGELKIEDARKILKEYSGKGTKINGGQKEIIDTKGKYRGIYKDQTGKSMPTSRFTIHYDSKGRAHIIPAHPTGK